MIKNIGSTKDSWRLLEIIGDCCRPLETTVDYWFSWRLLQTITDYWRLLEIVAFGGQYWILLGIVRDYWFCWKLLESVGFAIVCRRFMVETIVDCLCASAQMWSESILQATHLLYISGNTKTLHCIFVCII